MTELRLLLSIAGYAVIPATCGATALKLFRCNHVDLVIADHLLPDLGGGELITAMKRLKPEIPMVLFTGLAEPPSGLEQVNLFLTKGVTPPEFLAEIAKLLSNASAAETGTAPAVGVSPR